MKLNRVALVFGSLFVSLTSLQAEVPQLPSQVQVRVHQLTVRKRLPDGTLGAREPYLIKGVTWNPATRAPVQGPNPLGGGPVDYGFFFDWNGRNPQGHQLLNVWLRREIADRYAQDVPLIKAMNANTVRLYFDLDLNPLNDAQAISDYRQILDACYENGIMVVLSVGASRADLDSGRYLKVVEVAKNHPAILMWALGNEWNFNAFYGYGNAAEATAAVNAAARAIKAIDTNHPVTSVLGDIFSVRGNPQCPQSQPDFQSDIPTIVRGAPAVDIWGINVYRGTSFGALFKEWSRVSDKPFFLGEFGTDSYRSIEFQTKFSKPPCELDPRVSVIGGFPDENRQADFAEGLWKEIAPQLSAYNTERQCAGGFVHEWNDSLWKVGSFHIGPGKGLGELVEYGPFARNFQEYDEHGFLVEGHPDRVANEERFGVVTADRAPKEAYRRLQSFYRELVMVDPALTIVDPANPIVWHVGQTVEITWEYQGNPLYAPEPTTISLSEKDSTGSFRQILSISASTTTVKGLNRILWTVPEEALGENRQVSISFQRMMHYPTLGGGKIPYAQSDVFTIDGPVETVQAGSRPIAKPRKPTVRY